VAADLMSERVGLTESKHSMTKRALSLPSALRARWVAYLVALTATGATLLLRIASASWFGDRPMLLLFVLPIFLSASFGGLGPGLVSTAVAALGASYLLIPPLHSFAMASSVDTWDWLILISVGALVSALTDVRRERARSDEPAKRRDEFRAERKVQLGFGFALTCLGVVGAISFTSVTRFSEEADRARQTEEVIASLRGVLASVTDFETAERGFVITGDESFLEPYADARRRIDERLGGLGRLTADDAEQRRQLAILAPLVTERLELVASNLDLRRRQGFAAAKVAIASGQGKQLHDRMRVILARMEATERTLLQHRAKIAERSATVTRTVISFGSALAIGCVVVALFLIGSDFGGGRRAQSALKVANEQLEARVLERTRALGESEARLGGIVNSAMDAIISVNREQRVVLFNATAEKLFGCSAALALGQPLDQFIPAQHREHHHQHVEEFGATGVTSRSMRSLRALTALRADGTEFPIEASISQVEVLGEKIFTVILRDLTERNRAEQASALLASVVASSADAIVSKDLLGNVTSWNAGAEKMFGYSAGEMLGRSITTIIPPEAHPEEARILARIRDGERMEHFETVRQRKDGSRLDVSVTVSPIKDPSGRIVGASKSARDISERKSAEARAIWLSSFPERNPSPILEVDPSSGVVHYANPAALQQFPSLMSEGLQHPLVADLLAVTAQVVRQGTVHRELCVADSYFSQLLTSVADSPRVRIYSTDITDRRNAEQALREREAELHASDRQLAQIVQGMTEACFALDAQWCFTFVNDRVEVLAQRTREEMLGRAVWTMFPYIEGTELAANYRRVMAERVPISFEALSPGSGRWLEIRVFPTAEGIAAFLLDIHDRKLAEVEREKFVALVEYSAEFIGMRNLQGVPIFINKAALELVGLDSLEEAARMPPGQFFFPEDQAFIRDEFAPRVLRDGHGETELRFRHFKTGEAIWMIYNAFVVRGAHGEPIALATVSRNITERKRAEQQIRQLNTDLERRVAERTKQLEAANHELEAFSYSVSHDLRAPLRAVSGFSQIVLEDYGSLLPEAGKQSLQTICDGAQRMGMLIDDLLAFARLSRLPLTRQAIDVARQVQDCLHELEPERNGRAIDVRIADLPPCQGDPALLKQVWLNLLSNALKYSKNRELAVIEVGCTAQESQLVYFVRDNGTGFDMKYAGKLFGVFQRLHRQEEFAGTGVGLAIVQRIVNRHGGRVWADAALDHGATFYFTLSGAGA
jgi:PAS domain S-box-containing protein